MAFKAEGIIFVIGVSIYHLSPIQDTNDVPKGAPGAGKGTLSATLAQEYGFKHLSIGDLLRRVAASPGADKTIVEHVRRGEILTPSLLFPILKPHIEEGGIIILDGFPRRLDQARAFEKEVRTASPQLNLDKSLTFLVSTSCAGSILRLS